MARKATVLIEKDEHGFYAWCPELKSSHQSSWARRLRRRCLANIKEAAELYLETLPLEERDVALLGIARS